MTPSEVAQQVLARFTELGSIDAKIWTQIDVDLNTKYNTHAKAGVHCADCSVAEVIRIDPKLETIIANASEKDIDVLPYGDHTVLIFD